MKKILAVNADYLYVDTSIVKTVVETYQQQLNDSIITFDKELSIEGNKSELIKLAKTVDRIIFVMSKDNIDFSVLISIFLLLRHSLDKFYIIIDSSDFTDEENAIIDECIEEISDIARTVICDNRAEIIRFITTYIIRG